jgi:prepilin-type N-terminal cleavage/methylation domain-containing protein
MESSDHARRGMTAIEILVVVAILLILLGLLLPVLLLLQRNGRITATKDRMSHVGDAVRLYFDDWGALGNAPDSSDFAAAPARFLSVDPSKRGPPYLQPISDRMAKGAGPYALVGSPREWEQILDEFPTGDHSNRLEFEIVNGQKTVNGKPRFYPTSVTIRSRGPDRSDPKDDLILRYTTDSEQFEWVKP